MGFGQAPEEYEIRRGFLSETAEMLDDTESDFLRLEKNPSDKSIIERIFRLAHTIKGSAQLVEFHELGAFAHAMEFLLVKIRENKVEINSDVIDVLLKSNDLLKSFVEALQGSHDAHVETGEVLERLNHYLGANVAAHPRQTEGGQSQTAPASPVPLSLGGSPKTASEESAGSKPDSDSLGALCMRAYLLHMQLLKLHGDEIMTTEIMEVKGHLEENLKKIAKALK